MGSLWDPWVPLVTILGSLWDLVGVPWGSNGGFGSTLVCFVPPFLIPLTPFGLPLGSLGSLSTILGLLWDSVGAPWDSNGSFGKTTPIRRSSPNSIYTNSRSTAQAADMLVLLCAHFIACLSILSLHSYFLLHAC